MLRSAFLLTLVALCCPAAAPREVRALADRIEKLASREPLESAIDTRLRAALLIQTVDSELAGKFLKTALDDLRKHPEVPRQRTVTASMVALDPPGADDLLLAASDKVQAYNQLLWHRSSRGQLERTAALLRRALAEPAVTSSLQEFWGLERSLVPLAPAYPAQAAAFAAHATRVAFERKSGLDVARLMNTVLMALIDAPEKERATAIRTLIPVVSDERFPGEASPVKGVERTLNGHRITTRNGHETVLFRVGVFTSVLAPQVYQENCALFDPWEQAIRSVDSLEKLIAYSGRPRSGTAAAPPPPPYMVASAPDAFALVEKMPKREDRIAALENIALREDLTAAQQSQAVERARALIRADLEEMAAKPDQDSLMAHSLARNLRWAGIQLETSHPAIQSKLALIDLENAVQPAYDFSLPDLTGKVHRLSDQRGNVVLINFWATWCPPCRAEMPLLAKLHREWASKGLSMLAITDEPASTVSGFQKQFGYSVPVLLDPARKVFDHYRVQGIPDTRILDRSGHVIATFGELVSEEDIVRSLRAAGLK